MATGIAVAYDFFIGTVTNIIAAAVLDSKAPSLLDDCDPDKQKAEDSKDDYHGPGLTFSRIKKLSWTSSSFKLVGNCLQTVGWRDFKS